MRPTLTEQFLILAPLLSVTKRAIKHTTLALCCGLLCQGLAAGDSNPRLTAEERAKVINLLRESEAQFREAVEKLSDAQWAYKPAPDRWSVGEVAEHIALTEAALFSSVEKALAEKANPDWEAKTAKKTEFIERAVPSRERRVQAPEGVRPEGKLTRAEVMSRFKEVRAKTLKFVEQTDLPLKAHTYDHPFPVFNTLNAYQWLIYIPLHHLRHNQQILEVQATTGFPK